MDPQDTAAAPELELGPPLERRLMIENAEEAPIDWAAMRISQSEFEELTEGWAKKGVGEKEFSLN